MLGGSQAHKALVALAVLNAYAYNVHATTVTVKNSCSESIQLWDNSVVQTMSPGATVTRDLPIGYHGMFRAGVNPQATLAELAVEGGFLWYDISIIPTGPKSGPEYCPSLQACKDLTGGVGYNIPMQIAPSGCQTVTCMSDGCADAYHSVGSGSTGSADSSYAGFDTVGSDSFSSNAGSNNGQSLEAGALTPAPAAEFGSSTLNNVRQAGGSASGGTNVSAQTAETSSGSTGGTLMAVLAGVACVAGVAVFVTAKKKKALEQETVERKDSVLSVLPGDTEAMLTPIDNIQCI
uniref:Uncharacterized protein n=1 Tax=Globisporangium ultimum (strain ATCC 200006 / CBS 805.95 / DAOM BR144) TaxID=431595 RepID=K3WAN3_GLOUD